MNVIKNINDAIKREIKRLDKNNLTAFDQIAFLQNEIRLMRETMDLMQEELKKQHYSNALEERDRTIQELKQEIRKLENHIDIWVPKEQY